MKKIKRLLQFYFSIATVSGNLKVLNNQYRLLAFSDDKTNESSRSSKRSRRDNFSTTNPKEKLPNCHMFGKINISDLLQNLSSSGISTDKVEEPAGPGSCIIHLVSFGLPSFIEFDNLKTTLLKFDALFFCLFHRKKKKL